MRGVRGRRRGPRSGRPAVGGVGRYERGGRLGGRLGAAGSGGGTLGVHVDHLDLVVNVDPPTDHKDYLHRGG
ncbi:hypothetical protein AB0K23_34305, partial [Streptomyces sp. NPDC049602]|uniref:hypothetical protein n=1 Tax=Streptomyces sp. NPDC049602 TaxID=3155504 RepID=UPI003447A106